MKRSKQSKRNPHDIQYVMERDNCTLEQAQETVRLLKERCAHSKGKKLSSRRNPYDPQYVMERDNCTLEQALVSIEEFKSNKATSKANFIKKYGEEDGLRRYEEWKSKSLGKGHAFASKNGASQSKFSPSYYMRHGYSEEEAVILALEFQHKNSPLHVEYYLERGQTIEIARKKIRAIHDKKIGRDCFREKLQRDGIPESEINDIIKKSRGHCSRESLGDEEFEKRIDKMRSTFERSGTWIPLADLSDYQLYRREVWRYTNMNNLSTLPGYENRGLAGTAGATHLDHRYSISRGYVNNVPPELIGSIKNLEFKTWEENVAKQGKCDITIEELRNED